MIGKIFKRFIKAGLIPVSYTHLDVYKRQQESYTVASRYLKSWRSGNYNHLPTIATNSKENRQAQCTSIATFVYERIRIIIVFRINSLAVRYRLFIVTIRLTYIIATYLLPVIHGQTNSFSIQQTKIICHLLISLLVSGIPKDILNGQRALIRMLLPI